MINSLLFHKNLTYTMKIFKILFICCLATACQSKKVDQTKENTTHKVIEFKNKGHELVYQMSQKVGTYQQLKNLKDVVYTYTYLTPDQKKDSVIEKYIFDGELSYGKYLKHQRTLVDINGVLEQGYNGKDFWIKKDGILLNDDIALNKTKFNRKTNFYWFTMFQKLLDPGLNYEYLKEISIGNKIYDIVKVSFEYKDNKPTDIYQLYINKQTHLVDQFLFTVADYGVFETPLLMKVEYEKINGLLIPTKRQYTKANWEAKNLTENWTSVQWSNIKFNNNFDENIFD